MSLRYSLVPSEKVLLVSPSRVYDSERKCSDETGISDEMQIHVPQDEGSGIEVQTLMGVTKMIVSSQASGPIMGIIQDGLLGSYLLTQPDTPVAQHQFMNCMFSAGDKYIQGMASLFTRAKAHYKGDLFNGRVLFSALLPPNFQYRVRNNACKEEPEVIIVNGILIAGVVNKKIIGCSHGAIQHRLYKEYSPERAAEFLSVLQFIVNRWLSFRGFSVGLADFIISQENHDGVQMAIQKAYIEVETIEQSDDPPLLKEFKVNNALNNRGQQLAIDGLCKNNRLEVMIDSGSKGNKMNIIQISGHLGQNNVEGHRIRAEIDDGQRTLSCFKRGDKHPRCFGFIENSFFKGLAPEEIAMQAKAGREGVVNTAVKTRESGYAERRLVKRMEDLTVRVDGTVRNSVNNIVDFSYGDSLDPTLMYGSSFIDIGNVVERLNAEVPETEDDVLTTLRIKEREKELEQSIKEYRLTIKNLKMKKGAMYKKLLSAGQKKLKELLAEKKNL